MRKSELKEIIKSSFLAEAEDSKKGNSEEQKRAEGAIRDNKRHIKKLKKDLSFQEDKLSKLKKDSRRDVIKENEGQGNYNKTLKVIKSFEDGKVLQDFLKTFPKGKDVSKADYFTFVEKYYNEGQDDYYNEANWKYILSGDMSVFDDIAEGGEVDEGLLDFLKKKKEEAPKPKSGGSNEPIGVDYDGNYIYANEGMTEAEEVDVEDNEDVDIDIEDEVDIDDKETESDIEIKTSVPGESTDVEAVQGLLTKAQAEAEKLGDDKLLDQIGNTITYFTRAHVVKSANEDLESGEYGDPTDAELDVTKGGGDVAGILDAESELNLQEVKRFRKLAGLVK